MAPQEWWIDGMNVTETNAEGLHRELKIVVGADELEEKLSSRLEDLKSKARIKGFRTGHVPKEHLRKVYGRSVMAEVVQQGGYGYREIIVRCNGLETEWGARDIAELAALNIDGMLFPKIQSRSQVDEIVEKMK